MNEAGAAPVLSVRHLSRSFVQGGAEITVLRDASLSIAPGQLVALLGPSGSGKSTLLQAVGLLERGYLGEVVILGTRVDGLDDAARTRLRRERLGFVYQFHHLLPDFSAEENVVLPQLIAGSTPAAARERARSLLAALSLGARLDHRPAQLSGGEQQRVAVARALANRPPLILADEPTGNLDEATARRVFAKFVELARSEGAAALIATHNAQLAGEMDRVVELHEGELVERPSCKNP
ncbi:MAG: ABC transporter ATP-binding protein [Sphingomonadaceae bacterium]|nr:ABC transporter ATP-binding protein [Sphingomonadaceae bacterium]